MKLRHVVVDGSNIATEGREAPSLAQLDEAVQAFIREFEPERVTVVVDATFPNRINRNERKVYEEAVAAGEVITPPAGAIGRGDAFVLQIADRAGAAVLSNDSFQEFHGEYHWLFDKGRLVGGKPVPHVGWVFMDRAPVRGPTSRRATSAAARRGRGRERDATRPDGSTPAPAPSKAPQTPETSPGGAAKGGTAPGEAPRKRRRSKRAAEPVEAVDVVDAVVEHEPPPPSPEPIEPAEPAVTVAGAPDVASTPAYNEPGPFGDFLSRHPVGSDVEAVVESFGSHGAYLRCRSVRAYAPLKNLADPAPRSAKEVLKAGESRTFVVAEVDRARRGVDLALAGTPTAVAAVASRPPDQPKQPRRAKAAKKQAPAKAARSAEPDKSAKADTSDKSAKADRSDRSAKADRSDTSARADRSDTSAKADRSDKSAKADRSDKSARADRSDRAATADGTAGPSKQARAKKAARADKAKRASKSAKKASAEKKAASNPRQ